MSRETASIPHISAECRIKQHMHIYLVLLNKHLIQSRLEISDDKKEFFLEAELLRISDTSSDTKGSIEHAPNAKGPIAQYRHVGRPSNLQALGFMTHQGSIQLTIRFRLPGGCVPDSCLNKQRHERQLTEVLGGALGASG